MPVTRSASAMARPSGMSCRAMAVVNGSPTVMSPSAKLTPMAMPSGRLCKVMARTNSQTRLIRCTSGPRLPLCWCSWGTKRSSPTISAAPSPIPNTTTTAANIWLPVMDCAASMPGRISEKELAASIIPAAKPSIMSWVRTATSRSTRASKAPKAVAAKPAVPPSIAKCRIFGSAPVSAP
ncbi:hypothetical protein D3C87_1410840 [compost metagenome]